jgi:hypothetical protein
MNPCSPARGYTRVESETDSGCVTDLTVAILKFCKHGQRASELR